MKLDFYSRTVVYTSFEIRKKKWEGMQEKNIRNEIGISFKNNIL